MVRKTEVREATVARDATRLKELIGGGASVELSDCMAALKARDHGILQALVRSGVDLNAKDFHGFTPLVQAIELRDLEAARILSEAGASLECASSFGPPLHYSVLERYAEAVAWLIRAGVDINHRDSNGMTALTNAVRLKRNRMVEILLEAGADASVSDNFGKTALEWAAREKNRPAERLLSSYGVSGRIANRSSVEELIEAIRDGSRPGFLAALKHVADANVCDPFGTTPLQAAIDKGRTECVAKLLERNVVLNEEDEEGVLPLESALMKWQPQIVIMLLRAGAKPQLVDQKHCSALGTACAMKGYKVAEALLAAGADPNASTIPGRTPLMEAIRVGAEKCARLLLSRGADVNKADQEKRTALFFAVQGGMKPIAEQSPTGAASGSAKDELRKKLCKGAARLTGLLVANGADVDHADALGRTPITYANCEPVVTRLLEAGASLDVVDKRGRSVVYWMKKNSLADVLGGKRAQH